MKFAKIGAVFYIIWGLLHIIAAFQGFQLGASLEPGLVRGKINQGAWDLLFVSLAGISIAVIYIWKNNTLGYWLNLLLVSIADIGFIVFVLLPGYIDIFPGILGPIFWILAVIFSTLGIRTGKTG